jgi:hypothetical protein
VALVFDPPNLADDAILALKAVGERLTEIWLPRMTGTLQPKARSQPARASTVRVMSFPVFGLGRHIEIERPPFAA